MAREQGTEQRRLLVKVIVAVAVVVVFLVAYNLIWRKDEDALVVYCAHDSVYSEVVLRDFEKRTGIRVVPKFDTEATKALGLVEQLIAEKDAPRADVFWNNELLGIMQLQDAGVLQPYKGKGYQRIPPAFRDPDGHWVGFGARMRVYIVNTDKMAATPEAVEAAMAADDLSRVAMAKPLYGTTLTHYSVLWNALGGLGLKEQRSDWLRRGLKEVGGNADVKDLVAEGVCDLGWTDTDDFRDAKEAGQPVEAVPARTPEGRTICIPNTVAIVRGTWHLERAQALVDFLLSAETEEVLANSKAGQIPLGPVNEDNLPAHVLRFSGWARDGAELGELGAARNACIEWLKAEQMK